MSRQSISIPAEAKNMSYGRNLIRASVFRVEKSSGLNFKYNNWIL